MCAIVTVTVIRRESPQDLGSAADATEEKGVGPFEAFRLLRESKHLQIIAIVISFAAIGASLIEQQLNMAVAEQVKAAGGEAAADAITQRLGTVQFWDLHDRFCDSGLAGQPHPAIPGRGVRPHAAPDGSLDDSLG